MRIRGLNGVMSPKARPGPLKTRRLPGPKDGPKPICLNPPDLQGPRPPPMSGWGSGSWAYGPPATSTGQLLGPRQTEPCSQMLAVMEVA